MNIKLKSSYATYSTSKAKFLARDTANEHALERHAAAVRQLSNGTNGDDLCIHIATVGNTIQTVNSPMYYKYMSTPGNTAKETCTATYRQHKVDRPWLGANLYIKLVSTPLSQHFNPLCQPGMIYSYLYIHFYVCLYTHIIKLRCIVMYVIVILFYVFTKFRLNQISTKLID